MTRRPLLRIHHTASSWWMTISFRDCEHSKSLASLDAQEMLPTALGRRVAIAELRRAAAELWRDAITFGKGEAYRQSRLIANRDPG